MRLALADRTGIVAAVVWDDLDEAAAAATAGEPVRVIGSFAEHPRYGPQITVRSLLTRRDRLGPSTRRALDSGRGARAQARRAPRRAHRSPPDPLADATAWCRFEQRSRISPRVRGAIQPSRLPLWPARALAAGRRRRRGHGEHLRPDRPRPRARRRPATRHRQARRLLRRRSRRHPERRRQTDRRDPERLLHRAARDRADPGLPIRARPSPASHHPLAPRLPRTRQPGAPASREALVVHAIDKLSGDLGSFDRLDAGDDGR